MSHTLKKTDLCEHNGIIDRDQERFTRFKAVMRLFQDANNWFNDGENTVAILIDMEKAYDSVWREGLLYKLLNMGFVGRIWQWLFRTEKLPVYYRNTLAYMRLT